MKRKTLVIGVFVLLLIVGASVYWMNVSRGRDSGVSFQTRAVDRGDIAAKVTATGTLSAIVTVQVGSQVSGRIDEIFVDFNSKVHKGQVIARIEPRLFKAALDQAQANLQTARGNLVKAQAQAVQAAQDLNRQKLLFQQKLISQAELDSAEATSRVARATIQAAQGTVQQNRAAYDQAKVNLDYTQISSPIDGIVISRNIDVGQTVAAAFQAPTLFTIAEDLTRMQVDTSVAEADIGKLAPDMATTFLVDAFPHETFEGKIRQIRNAPISVQNVVTYDAVIDVENPALKLKPGMTANVTVAYAQVSQILKVPNAAFRYRPATADDEADGSKGGRKGEGGGANKITALNVRTLYRLEGGLPRPLRIKVGLSDGNFTEVVEGELREGDAIVVGNEGPKGKGAAGSGPGSGGGTRRLF